MLTYRKYKKDRKRKAGDASANVLVCEAYWEIEQKTEGIGHLLRFPEVLQTHP